MADLSITAASVQPGSDAVIRRGTAGATITAGQAVYADSSDAGQIKAADADAEASAAAVGIALCGASDEQPVSYQIGGSITIGATVTVGQVYVASTTAGGIAPYSDLASGDYVTILGVGTTTAAIKVDLLVSGVAKP